MADDVAAVDNASFTPDAMEAQLMAEAGALPVTPEKEVVSAPPEVPSQPFYEGFLGAIKTPEELKAYTKNLEDTVVRMQAGASKVIPPVAAVVSTGPSIDEQIDAVWFSDPAKARELMRQKDKAERDAEKETHRVQTEFWGSFYQKNPDLKRVERIVQSIVREKGAEISQIRTAQETSEFIARETREVIGLVGKAFSGKETRLESAPAITLGASGETPPAPPVTPPKPLTFIDQIRKGQRRSSGKK